MVIPLVAPFSAFAVPHLAALASIQPASVAPIAALVGTCPGWGCRRRSPVGDPPPSARTRQVQSHILRSSIDH